MSSRSHRKFLKSIDKSFSFKDRVAVGQYIRKLELNQIKLDDVPEDIRAMIHVEKPAEVKVETVADVVEHLPDEAEPDIIDVPFEPVEVHAHGEHCHHGTDDAEDRLQLEAVNE